MRSTYHLTKSDIVEACENLVRSTARPPKGAELRVTFDVSTGPADPGHYAPGDETPISATVEVVEAPAEVAASRTFGEVAEVGATYEHIEGWRIEVSKVDDIYVWGGCYALRNGRKDSVRMPGIDAGTPADRFTKVEG